MFFNRTHNNFSDILVTMGDTVVKIEAVSVQHVVVVVDCVRGCDAERVEGLFEWTRMTGDVELDETSDCVVARIAFW